MTSRQPAQTSSRRTTTAGRIRRRVPHLAGPGASDTPRSDVRWRVPDESRRMECHYRHYRHEHHGQPGVSRIAMPGTASPENRRYRKTCQTPLRLSSCQSPRMIIGDRDRSGSRQDRPSTTCSRGFSLRNDGRRRRRRVTAAAISVHLSATRRLAHASSLSHGDRSGRHPDVPPTFPAPMTDSHLHTPSCCPGMTEASSYGVISGHVGFGTRGSTAELNSRTTRSRWKPRRR
jgi:hypothetical protein